MPRYQTTSKILKEAQAAFSVATSDLQVMVRNFHDEMRRGLAGESSSLKMLPAFIGCPTGKERGTYLGLDLGGTNFRVLQVQLQGYGEAKVEHVEAYTIPQEFTRGKGRELFDFIATALSDFVGAKELSDKKQMLLGFSFSFPVKQAGIAQGKLIKWTKEFGAADVVNRDVVQFLEDSLSRKGIECLRVVALTNDTVGALIANAYVAKDCDVGVIFGTGTNGCYLEEERAISSLSRPAATKKMIVNTEWGNFNLLSGNKYDQELDKRSRDQGSQLFEKKISGKYLGELTRLVLKDLIGQGVLLDNHTSKFRKGRLTTRDMASFERDRTADLAKVKSYLTELGMESSLEERKIIRQVCRFVSRRAARVSAAAISALVTRMDTELSQTHTVAVDGTVYSNYPGFKKKIMQALEQIHGERGEKIKLTAVKDGSGIGAAIAAAVAGTVN